MKPARLFPVVIVFLIAGCARTSEQEFMSRAERALDANKPTEALKIYRSMVADYPHGVFTPEALYRIGSLELSEEKQPAQAVATLARVVDDFPQSSVAHKCLFLAAFTYGNSLNDTAKARAAYERYLAAYPDSSMAETARFELAHLGRTADEILSSIQDSAKAGAPKVATR